MNRVLGVLFVALLAVGLGGCKNDDDDNGGGSGGGVTGPEIGLARGVTNIADGGTDNLGSTPFGTPQPITYTINNTGTLPLTLNGVPLVQVSGASNCSANVTTLPVTPVVASGNTTFVVTLTVTAAGAFTVQISIANDDSNENPYDFTMSGTGASVPEIDVQRPASTSIADGGADALGNLGVGANPATTWTIANLGTAALTLTGGTPVTTANTTNCSVAVTQPATSSVAAAGSTTFSITITTSGAGAFSFDILVASNDADENPYNINVTGTAVLLGILEVFAPKASIAASSTTDLGTLAQDSFTAIPVAIRNSGGASLSISSVSTSGAVNCVATIRDQAPATLAVAETSTFVVLLQTQTSGAISFQVTINNSSAVPAFSFTLTATHCNPTRVLYLEQNANGPDLQAASFPGAASPTVISGTIVAGGASGVTEYYHLNDRVLYAEQLTVGGPKNIFFRGIPPTAPATPQAVTTATQVGTTGSAGNIVFTSGDNFAFIASNNSGPGGVYTCTLSGTTVGTPLLVSGTVAGGASGASAIFPSPRGDMLAFIGAMDTAGVNELYLVNTNGTGSRTKLNATLSAGRTINFQSIRWLPDQRGILYEEDNFGSAPRHLFFARATATPNPTRLNAVPASGVGVVPLNGFSGQVNSVQVSRSSDRVFFLFQDAAGGTQDLFMTTIALSGTLTTTSVNGGTAPGTTTGVVGFTINYAGSRAVFVADSGTSSAQELFEVSVSGTTPTTTKIVAVSTAGRLGVKLDDFRSLISSFRFWFTNDDVVANREELFFTDVSSTAANTRLPGNGTFTGTSGVALTGVVPHPDGARMVFVTNQKTAASANLCVYVTTVSSTPAATQLSVATAGGPGLVTLGGDRVYYAKDNGAAPTQCFSNLLSGTTASEVQISGAELGGGGGILQIVPFSSGRVFYHYFTSGPEGIASANTSGTITRDVIDTNNSGYSPAPGFKLGFEAR